MTHVLITGITGMDGSILADQLLVSGHHVYGLVRRSASPNYWRIQHQLDNPHLVLIDGDITSQESIFRALEQAEPKIVFNLAAQSFVPYSWSAPVNTFEINSIGVLNVLEAIRNIDRSIKFYQASSSEMFGKVMETPQKETTPFYPRSPYGVSKAAAHYATVNYHESFGIHATSGILFNHEHERRGETFVSRKVTQGIAKIFALKQKGMHYEPLKIGNLEAKRDWGYAEDYVRAMIDIVNYPTAETFVIATGITRSVRELCEAAVSAAVQTLELTPQNVVWKGTQENEIGLFDGEPLIVVSKEFYRPAEVDLLLGDASKAKKLLGWAPEVSFEEMVRRMFAFDVSHNVSVNV
ncbi:MAG: GDP-mannose 4,6-dehydratase [Parachlamydiaceae bacterium]